ncbi:MAG: hypothetical protein V3G42_08530 [Oscillospiraceae bacterium]
MAFSDKYKADGEQCPICRQFFTDGRKIREEAYGKKCSLILCEKCYQRYYQNSAKNRNVAIQDDNEDIFVKFRPAESLENDRLLKKERPQSGYEFPLSYLLPEQIIHDVAIWGVMCLIMRLCLSIGITGDIEDSFSWVILKYFTMIGCIGGIIQLIRHLLMAICYGVGLTRILVLTGAVIFLIVMILVTI